MKRERTAQYLSAVIYTLTTGMGLIAFALPFFHPVYAGQTGPWLLTVAVTVCFVALLLESQRDLSGPKFVALLGVLTAINATLRLAETAIPGPGGFSPIFFLIVVGGYVFGGRFGFLLGALTLLLSAFLTGGVGPWLPYQMLTAGWVGLTAPVARWPVRLLRVEGRPAESTLLALIGAGWGWLYGFIINLWFWPFFLASTEGIDPATRWRQYLFFYAATSWAWDTARALGNAALLALLGNPTLRVMRRFRRRLCFTYHPPRSAAPTPSAPTACAALDVEVEMEGRPCSADAPPPHRPAASWLIWAVLLTIAVSIVDNPLYRLLMFAGCGLVAQATGRRATLRWSLAVVPATVVFNLLFAHYGETVLLRLPETLPFIGGAITAEALVYGLNNGLALATLIAAFAVLNGVLTAHDVIRLAPTAFHPAAVSLTIAATFIPATRQQMQEIREAQAVRGHQMRRLRDWLPLLIPLLVSGLERAMQLAEAMTARGMVVKGQLSQAQQRLIVASLWLVTIGSVLITATGQAALGLIALLGGGGMLVWAMRRVQRRRPTRYRATRWTVWDVATVVGAAIATAAVTFATRAEPYTPYPRLTLPPFNVGAGVALLGFLIPVVPMLREAVRDTDL